MAHSSLAKHKMLIVDDDRNLLVGLFRALRRKYDIQVAASADIAIEVIRESRPFDVILCDWRMPGLDGMDFLERARHIAPFSVRIMISGASEDPFEANPDVARFFHTYLRKPCTPGEIWQAVEKHMMR